MQWAIHKIMTRRKRCLPQTNNKKHKAREEIEKTKVATVNNVKFQCR